MVQRLGYILPLAVLAVLAGWFWLGLQRDPSVLPSALIDRPVPEFSLAAIKGRDQGLSSADLKGEVVLVNVFGSWCVSCQIEHPFLMQLKENNIIPIHGIDWREQTPEAGPAWLKRYGDPYTLVGYDPQSKGAIAFGVTGAPETFVVDKGGYIRYKHQGPLTADHWNATVLPIVQKLRAE